MDFVLFICVVAVLHCYVPPCLFLFLFFLFLSHSRVLLFSWSWRRHKTVFSKRFCLIPDGFVFVFICSFDFIYFLGGCVVPGFVTVANFCLQTDLFCVITLSIQNISCVKSFRVSFSFFLLATIVFMNHFSNSSRRVGIVFFFFFFVSCLLLPLSFLYYFLSFFTSQFIWNLFTESCQYFVFIAAVERVHTGIGLKMTQTNSFNSKLSKLI